MNKRVFGKAIALLLVLTMCFGFGCAKKNDTKTIAGYALEPSEGTYAYVIHTPHATWHLAAADIELLGEEKFFEGLELFLENQEADFTDAIAALDGYLDEVPVIDIYTDLSGRTEEARSGNFGAYCRWNVPCIELYQPDGAFEGLLHEYVHYLTHCCMRCEIVGDFWSEAIAEYVSMFACKNRILHSAFTEEGRTIYAEHGFADGDGNPDLYKICCAAAAAYRDGSMVGQTFTPVSQASVRMTERMVEHPMLTMLSYQETVCFFDWLVKRYGKEFVFEHMTIGQGDFADVFGEDFETLFLTWAEDNQAFCEENGLDRSVWGN